MAGGLWSVQSIRKTERKPHRFSRELHRLRTTLISSNGGIFNDLMPPTAPTLFLRQGLTLAQAHLELSILLPHPGMALV